MLSSIQVYWMSVFELPSTIIKELGRVFKDFLWNRGDKKRVVQKLHGRIFVNLKIKVAWFEGFEKME